MGFSGFRVLGFRDSGLGLGVWGLRFRVEGSGCGGFMVGWAFAGLRDSRQELVAEIGKAHVQGLKPDVEVQEVESTIKSLAGCMYAKAAKEALENIYGPECRVMATRQLADIPLGFYSAIIMGRLFGLDVLSVRGAQLDLIHF